MLQIVFEATWVRLWSLCSQCCENLIWYLILSCLDCVSMIDEKLQGSGFFCLGVGEKTHMLVVGMETRWLANKQKFIIAAITPLLCTVQPKFNNEMAHAFVLSPNQYHACFCVFLIITETSVSVSVLDELLRRRLKSGALKVNASGSVKPAYVVNTNMMWGFGWLPSVWVQPEHMRLLLIYGSAWGWELRKAKRAWRQKRSYRFRWKFWVIEPMNNVLCWLCITCGLFNIRVWRKL